MTLRDTCRILMTGLVLGTVLIAAAAMADPAYVRQPDLHGDLLVFCAEADLWIASSDGSNPRRLTTHDGTEFSPSFSPDGKVIAFTGLYDGNNDVYTVPVEGGQPKRLTWHPGSEEVVGWTPDGESIIFRARYSDPMGSQHLFVVDKNGGEPVELPLGWASRIHMDEATGQWAFVRNNRENRPWKRYRGGWTSDVWVGHPDRADFRKATDFDGMDHFPMWHSDRIFFLSDMGGTSNLWSMQPDGTDRRRHTRYDEWDIRWPAMADDGRIVYTLAADVYIFDPTSDRSRKVDIDLGSDVVLTRQRYPNAAGAISEIDITPSGDRIAVVARGEVFSVPTEGGVTLPVSRGTDARERNVVFDPKAEKLLYLTDKGHEEEMQSIDAWGRGTPEVVQEAKTGVWHYQPRFSPDGGLIAYADNSYGLFVMKADGGDLKEIDRGTEREIRDYRWSPDGRWLAYVKVLPNRVNSIFIYDTTEERIHAVNDSYTNDYWPAWDPDGRYLYFCSDRAINPLIDELDFNATEIKNDKLYAVMLREDVDNPLLELAGLPPEDEEESGGQESKDEDAEEEGDEEADETPDSIEIDIEGLRGRVIELPIEMGNYYALQATSTHLFYISNPVRGIVEEGDFFTRIPAQNSLMSFSLADKEAKSFVTQLDGYIIAAEGGKMAIRKDGSIYVVDTTAPPGADLAEKEVDLSEMVVELDPRSEWSQIYYEAWRQMREFYWDDEFSGLDMDDLRDQYAKLLPRLASRADLGDLLAQLYGEMNTSHTYVIGGDAGVSATRVATGLLGAKMLRESDNVFKVESIYRGSDPDRVRSPLDVPGVDIEEGDYILAVNGRPLAADRPFYANLENLAGKQVILTVSDAPKLGGSRTVVVTPMRSDRDLRYSDWVRQNREYVLEKTDSKMGYIHIPDMLNPGMIEFNTWFYPQLDKEGLVVDVRWNGGGSYSQIMLERLRRKVLSWSYYRGGAKGSYPARVLNGPFVVLVNESSGSDGDIFPQAVQLEGLAPIIGSRTWGGVNGITSLRPLVDGGLVTQSQVAWWDPQDEWALENRGVIPDIEVLTLPQDIARGVDTQLDRGIEELLRLHAENPPAEPNFGKSMRRTRDSYKNELTD